jgi:hypothetical protein
VLKVCLICSLAAPGNSWAESIEMDVLETDDLRLLYFDPAQTHLVPHVIRTYHNSLAFQKYIFDWSPYERPTILLTDFSDYGNAGAGASPHNGVIVDIAPLSTSFETIVGSDRIFATMNHELVHVANLDVANSRDLKWRRFFSGKPRQINAHPETILYNYLATPRMNVPRWYTEGAAVFMETWMSGGVGRAQGAYDEMVFRSMVRDDAHFFSNLGLVSEGTAVDFQVGVNAYLYGTRFISYMALQHSPSRVVEWLKRGDDSQRYYSKQFKHVFGMDLETAWGEWIAWEHEFQARNLEAVREHPVTAAEPLSRQPLGSISRSFFDPEKQVMIGGFRYPGVVAHVGALSLADGSIEHLTDIKGPMLYRVTSPAYDPDTGTLFYTADNFNFRDLMILDVETGQERMLFRDARIGDLAFDGKDRSLWGLRHLNGYVTLVRIPPPYEEWSQVYTWPYGQVPSELDVSPDGRLISASMGEINGDQFLRVFEVSELLAGRADPVAEFNFGTAVPEGFVFSPDGRYLFGSSYYTGVSNIFRYELATGDVEAVSNAETGFFRPIPLPDGKLIVFEFTGQGFLPAVIDPVPLEHVGATRFLGNEIARRYQEVRDWSVVDSLVDVRHEELITFEGKYRPRNELGFGSAYPIVEGYRDYASLGWHFRLEDPAQLQHLNLTAGYSWDDELSSSEKLHLNVEYQTPNWHLEYWHNDADFYDLFGPTERSRNGDAFLVGYERSLIYDSPRRLGFSADLNYYTGLDTLPDNQNVSTFIFEDILTAVVGLDYTNTRKSLGAVDHEKGLRWDLTLKLDHARGETVPKLRAGLDFGFALPWKHSSVWLYSSAGRADGSRANPLTNYYFGGFGNNYVDDGEVKRYRSYFSLPGWEIGAVSAREYAKTVLEWNLPPKRFRQVGMPSFFLKHLRPAVFFGALVADPGERYERTVTSAGFQVDLEFTLAHRLPMTLSVGYAKGYENGREHDDEWMVSLKIL